MSRNVSGTAGFEETKGKKLSICSFSDRIYDIQ